MRFATFAAFMLPLAALAAPIPTPQPPQWDQLDAARKEFADALGITGNAIDLAIHQLSDFQDVPALKIIFQTAQLANTNFGFGAQAASRIATAIQNHYTPSDAEYVDSLCEYTILENELTRRFCSL